jgi:hypothetical protein
MDADDLAAFDERASAVGEALWPATVVIGGSQYAASATEPRQRDILTDGGEEVQGEEWVVRVRKSQLPVRPPRNIALLGLERRWIIREVSGTLGACWILRCEHY